MSEPGRRRVRGFPCVFDQGWRGPRPTIAKASPQSVELCAQDPAGGRIRSGLCYDQVSLKAPLPAGDRLRRADLGPGRALALQSTRAEAWG